MCNDAGPAAGGCDVTDHVTGGRGEDNTNSQAGSHGEFFPGRTRSEMEMRRPPGIWTGGIDRKASQMCETSDDNDRAESTPGYCEGRVPSC